MINLDNHIVAFISNNWITLSLALGMLKIISKMTSWVHDDAIYTLLAGLFNQVRGKPPVSELPPSQRGDGDIRG